MLTTSMVLAVIALTALLGVAVWVESGLNRVAVFADYPGRPAAAGGTTWLLVGSDSRQGLTPEQQAALSTGGELGNGRTDTILLVHIPGLGARVPATVVSIPRDSYVDIPGWGTDKINVAFAEGGPILLARTVEQATGVRLDHYAEVGFAGFGAVVDSVGGVRVCLPDPVADPLAGIDLPAGCQTLNGPDALGYVRSRATPRADLDRMEHQRSVVSALQSRAVSPAVWLNPWRWYAAPRALLDALTVDAGTHVWDLAWLGWSLRDADAVTVPIGEFVTNDSGDVVIWDYAAAAALFTALRTDSAIPPDVLEAQP